jgi:hypothetical protein
VGVALCLATIALAMALLERPRPGIAVALGAAAALAALVHQMHLLLLPAVAAAPLLAGRTRPEQARLLFRALGTGILFLAGGYALAASARGLDDSAAVWRWMTAYGRDGRWWDFDLAENLRRDLDALARVVAADAERLSARVAGLLREATALRILGLLLLSLPALLKCGRQIALCVFWLAPYAAFFTVWVPGYYAYWVPTAFGLLLLAGLLLEGSLRALLATLVLRAPRSALRVKAERLGPGHSLPTRSAEHGARSRAEGAPLRAPVGEGLRFAALILCGIAAWRLAGVNAPVLERRRQPGSNPYLMMAREVEAQTRGAGARGRSSDLVLIAGVGPCAALEAYVPYFARRNLVTLVHALKHHGSANGPREPGAMRWLERRLEQSWGRGAQVYLFPDVLSLPPTFSAIARRYQVAPAELESFFQQYAKEYAFTARGHPVYRLRPAHPIPREG